MNNQIEYKRITRFSLFQQGIMMIVVFIAFTLIADSISLALLASADMVLITLYLYSLDKKIKASISFPIYIVLSAGLYLVLFFELSNLSLFLGLNLSVVIILFISNVIRGLSQLKTPPYVIDGRYLIEDAKKHQIKTLKIMFLVLAGLLIILLILSIFLTWWKNSLI